MEIFLTNVTSNITGQSRRATLNGREYLVCSVVMIVPGVLPGSKGPLLYPEDEVATNYGAWNGMPLTARHPTLNGVPVSARTPEVVHKFKLGEVYTTNYDGRLVAEAWFDVELTRRIDNRILQAIESGKKVEISTGLYTQNHVAPDGSVHNGVPYTHIARNYRPDHLAVLMDEVGVCSIRDGCGLNVNSSNPTENSAMKDQLIAWLTTNCQCWKGTNAGTALNAMTEPELQQLKTTAENSIATNNRLQQINGTLIAGVVVNGVKVVFDPTTNSFKAEQVAPAANGIPQVIELKPVGQQGDVRNETFLQLLERTGTPQEKEVWNSAVAVANAEKTQIINALTSHITDATAKANAQVVYAAMQLPDLRKIAPATPIANGVNGSPTPIFALGAGGPLANLNAGAANLTVNKVDGLPVGKLTFENPLNKKAS